MAMFYVRSVHHLHWHFCMHLHDIQVNIAVFHSFCNFYQLDVSNLHSIWCLKWDGNWSWTISNPRKKKNMGKFFIYHTHTSKLSNLCTLSDLLVVSVSVLFALNLKLIRLDWIGGGGDKKRENKNENCSIKKNKKNLLKLTKWHAHAQSVFGILWIHSHTIFHHSNSISILWLDLYTSTVNFLKNNLSEKSPNHRYALR